MKSCNDAGHGAQEDDITRVLNWAVDVRNNATLLNLVMWGLMAIGVGPDGEIGFYLTEEGSRTAEATP